MATHETIPIRIVADVDVGIADVVLYLNTLPGVRTHASCQGSAGYGPYVMASWPPEMDERLRGEFSMDEQGEGWGYLRPKEAK